MRQSGDEISSHCLVTQWDLMAFSEHAASTPSRITSHEGPGLHHHHHHAAAVWCGGPQGVNLQPSTLEVVVGALGVVGAPGAVLCCVVPHSWAWAACTFKTNQLCLSKLHMPCASHHVPLPAPTKQHTLPAAFLAKSKFGLFCQCSVDYSGTPTPASINHTLLPQPADFGVLMWSPDMR